MSSVRFLIGKTLGKYEILEHIGHGGMSEVYKGQQAQLDRMVAIKVLHPFLADDQGFVVRFQREARIVATMRHPNIVQVYDFDYNEPLALYYMVMEYIEGPTLKDRLQEGALSCEQVIHIGAAVAGALDYAHQRAMVHRDIKPANIMFLSEAEPVLTDFGIARMLTLSGLTASGAMVGTPAYMAPEIGKGKAGTASSDIYSLSVVLYEAITGQLPFSAESPMGMVMEHINTPPPRPRLLAPSIPTALEEIIVRGLEKEPEDRFSSAGEMADALRLALDLGEESPFVRPLSSVVASAGQGLSLPQDDGLKDGTSPPEPGGAEEGTPASTGVVGNAGEERLAELQEMSTTSQTDAGMIASPQPERKLPGSRWRIGWPRLSLLALLASVIGGGIWLMAGDGSSIALQGLHSPASVDAVTASPLPSAPISSPTRTPSPSVTPQVTPLGNVVPTPTATPVCTLRVHQDGVRVEPDPIVAPGTPLVAYIALDNSGNCAWPSGAGLVFSGGHSLGAREAFTVTSLAPGATVQILVPMTAPEETGVYSSTWEMHQVDGSPFGSRIVVQITVDDIATPTPTSTPDIAPDIATPEPLALADVELLEWQDDPDSGQWSGVARVQATGGTGTYRYYRDEVSETTQLPAGELTFEWRRCQSVPLKIWVLSGDEVLDWQGEIPYPDPDTCN